MDNEFFQRFGSWTPLSRPMPAPETDISSDPLMGLYFNADWRPAIVAALSILARPESWSHEDRDFILAAADNGQDIRTRIGSIPKFAFNWHFTVDITDPDNSPGVFLMSRSIPGDGRFFPTHGGFCYDDNFENATHIDLKGHSYLGDPGTGGQVQQLFLQTGVPLIGNVWEVSVTDCLGFTTVYTEGGNVFGLDDFNAKEIVIDALGTFFIWIVLKEDYNCTSA